MSTNKIYTAKTENNMQAHIKTFYVQSNWFKLSNISVKLKTTGSFNRRGF